MKHIESHIKINKTKAIPRHVVGKTATVKNYRKLGMFFYCSLFFFSSSHLSGIASFIQLKLHFVIAF